MVQKDKGGTTLLYGNREPTRTKCDYLIGDYGCSMLSLLTNSSKDSLISSLDCVQHRIAKFFMSFNLILDFAYPSICNLDMERNMQSDLALRH